MKNNIKTFIYTLLLVVIGLWVINCSGGGGGIEPPSPTFPTFTTDITTTTFPNPTTTITTTITNTLPTTTTTNTTTTNSNNYKYLYVKVLRLTSNGIQWLGSYEWNDYAYVHFSADNWNNSLTAYVNDGYYGTYKRFNYDSYTADYVDIGIYRYYVNYDYDVKIGDSYYTSSDAWYGQFTVDSYRPYGSSIYIVFRQGAFSNRLRNRR